MKKTPKRPKRAVPRIARGIAPTAAIASGLLAPPLLAAPGDLDPSFGDMGRVNSVGNFKGTAWAIKPLTGGQSIIGGGESFDFDCSYYHCSSDGFMGRISASGTLDEPYTATLLSGTEVNDFVLQPDGKLVATGQDDSRTAQLIVFRLEADGALDAGFADGGVLRYPRANNAAGQSVVLDPSGAIVVAGSSDGDLPILAAKEEDQKAVMTVRRLGGAAGQVSVAYHTADYTGADAATATAGADYTAVSGRLTWADGDFSDRQMITVPILADSGQVEEAERFVIALDDVQGGAGVGTEGVVEIAADGAPSGQFGFADSALTVLANAGTVQVYVYRNYYSQGAVSVTVTPVPGSATSADFSPTPIVLSWADGDSSWQTANIPITNSGAESPRSFTVQLSNPTNGALVGPHSSLAVTINPIVTSPGGSGGGAFDWLALLGLACLRWLRRRSD